VRPGRKVKEGARLSFGEGALSAEVISITEGGNRLIRFSYEGIFLELLERLGKMPLPPYIKTELLDAERYQTVYSRVLGSAAAPTAGLHFTKALLAREGAGRFRLPHHAARRSRHFSTCKGKRHCRP
jgi:S-adenosylmethionine:tRNA ribosyltransferase-isomerase